MGCWGADCSLESAEYFTLIALEQKRRPHSPHTSQPEPRPPRPGPRTSRGLELAPGCTSRVKYRFTSYVIFGGHFFIPGPQVFRPLGQGGDMSVSAPRSGAARRQFVCGGVISTEFNGFLI